MESAAADKSVHIYTRNEHVGKFHYNLEALWETHNIYITYNRASCFVIEGKLNDRMKLMVARAFIESLSDDSIYIFRAIDTSTEVMFDWIHIIAEAQ